MPRPEVRNDSVEAIEKYTKYYRNRGPNRLFARLGHFAMSKFYVPRMTWHPEAPEIMREELAAGAQAIIYTDHKTKFDQFNMAAMVRLLRFMRPVITKTAILAKPEIFDMHGPKHIAQRYAVDALGAFPGVRSQDSDDKELQRLASDGSINNSVKKIVEDHLHLALFPPGTRTPFSLEVGKPKSGIARIYEAVKEADPDRRLVLVGGGWWYGADENEFDPKHPGFHLARPITQQFTDRDELLEVVHYTMQASADIARANFVPPQIN